MFGKAIESFFMELGFRVDKTQLSNMEKQMDSARSSVLSLANVVGVALTSGFAMLGRSLLQTASDFERYETVLAGIEGSEEKGKKALEWVNKFAATTPYELDEVTQAFVRLRAYGMNPMNGLLQTLGDTSASMSKPLMMAVEAIADAITGENERLKEFGIKARVVGEQITYSYAKDGKTLTKTADRRNQAMIQSTLEAIWNERYAGSMVKLSKTWGGMWSNLMDSITRMKQFIMNSGPFETMKNGLESLLVSINQAFDSGQVKKYATVAGFVFQTIVNLFGQVAKVLDLVVTHTIGWKVVLGALAVILGGLFATAVSKSIALVFGLAKGVMAFNLAAALPAMLIGGIVIAVSLLVDELVNFYEGNDSIIGQLNQEYPGAIYGAWALLGLLGAGFLALKAKAIVSMVQTMAIMSLYAWDFVKLAGRASVSFAVMSAGWIKSAAVAFASGLRMAAAWVLALGPIAWVTAAVVAAAGLIWYYWDELSAWISEAWGTSMSAITNSISAVGDWFIGVFDSATRKVMGFVDTVMGAIKWVGEFLGLADAASNVRIAVNDSQVAATAAGDYLPTGDLWTSNTTSNSHVSTQNNTTITAPITINSPDPAQAGEAVRNELDRLNRQALRNGQTAVAL